MKILFYRYNSICEPDFLEVMENLGHVTNEIREEMENKEITAKEQMELVSGALKSNSYDMVFTVNFFPVLSEVCNIFHIPYVCWIVDSPVMELYSHSIRNSWNRIFLFDYALYQEFYGENPANIFYLPLGVHHTRVDKVIDSITEEERKRYTADVSFIGSLYTEKCPYNRFQEENTYLRGYLDGLIEAQLQVYGYNFLEECITESVLQNFQKSVPFYRFPQKSVKNEKAAMAHLYLGNKVTEQERLRLLKAVSEKFPLDLYTGSDITPLPMVKYKGLAKTKEEMPKIFHLSKINLNFTSKPIRSGLPLRIWDIMGAGGFVLSNYQSEIPEYFEVGQEIEVFSSRQELLEKIQYYLENEEERKQIAKQGYLRCQKEDTLEIRMKALLQMAGFEDFR